jgi:hypothetical protein
VRAWKKTRAKAAKQPPAVPPGWRMEVREANSTSEFLLGKAPGQPALGLRHLSGKPAGVWSLERPAQPGGRRYHLHLTYLAEGEGRCAVYFKPADGTAYELETLPATGGRWRQARVYFELATAKPFRLDFRNPLMGEVNSLYLRDVCITDAGGLDEDYAVAREDWRQAGPFRLAVKGSGVVGQGGQPPPGWSAQAADPDAKGELALEQVGGRPALAVRGPEGKPPLTLSWSGHRLRGGRTYRLVLEYRAAAGVIGQIRVRQAVGPPTQLGTLTRTGSEWQTVRVEFVAARDGKASVVLAKRGQRPENALHVGRVELIEKATGP